jgi:hypothetical protein
VFKIEKLLDPSFSLLLLLLAIQLFFTETVAEKVFSIYLYVINTDTIWNLVNILIEVHCYMHIRAFMCSWTEMGVATDFFLLESQVQRP